MSDPLQLFPGRVFVSTVLEALVTKTTLSGAMARRYLQRAAMAGFLIGIFYVTHYAVVAAFDAVAVGGGAAGDPTTLRPIGRLVGAVVFGFALVFIYWSRSELLTSNMMIVSVGAYHRRTGWGHALRLLGLCYLGNALGGLVVAALLRVSTLTDGPVLAEMVAAVEHKLAYATDGPGGWADLLVRAALCNFCINIAMLLVYNGLIKDDLTKAVVMIASVFVFAFLGLEHSVANTVLFAIVGLEQGIAVGPALGNVGLALLGNYVGGGLLVGFFYAYVNDDRRWLAGRPDRQQQGPGGA
ncbi:formate/nitrite transporter family protein [Cellulomonas marina]|uniref:Formate/nitrite transporter FocA, FNT family n=1 Tax=Cellulomonas marina TaxID=988821 RepID=A0A1I0Z8G1_9CELL|nr:formate/nitrite transporter family protein [Cellulomonas marina]GIG29049.1 formate/nitrite transporter family protein [Cellulomonas marina]SFB21637.1 Formate/nitrite transporter FocA, FNT family [Cellulomonas marina]